MIQELGGYTPDMQLQKNQERANAAYQSAIAPAVSSLNASRPEIDTSYQTRQNQLEAEKDPLKARYAKLISDIRGDTAAQVTDTTRVSAQEFGRRGIPLSSTGYQEENLRRIQPIQQAGESQVVNASLDQEEKLKGLDDTITQLTQEKIAAQRDVTNTIAQIQANSGIQAAQQAFQMWQTQQQQREDALNRAIQERLATVQEINAKTTASKPNTAEVQGGLYDVTNNKWIVPPKASSASSGGALDFLGLGLDTNNVGVTVPYRSAKIAGDQSVTLTQPSSNNSGWEIIP